jgi:hypothetical protein
MLLYHHARRKVRIAKPKWGRKPRGEIEMRRETLNCETHEQAEDLAPWAAIIVQVEGGWMAFESMADYETWSKQV